MSEKHLAERLMYPLPDGWRDDPEQVAALKEIWPKIITKNKELIDAEITSLRAQLDEAKARVKTLEMAITQLPEMPAILNERAARRKAIEECAAIAKTYGGDCDLMISEFRALLSESTT